MSPVQLKARYDHTLFPLRKFPKFFQFVFHLSPTFCKRVFKVFFFCEYWVGFVRVVTKRG